MKAQKKYNQPSTQKQMLEKEPKLAEPQAEKVFYLQCSNIEKLAHNKRLVRFIRVKANENPFINQNPMLVYSCRFGANGEFSTANESTIIWGNSYLKICFIDVEARQVRRSLYKLNKAV